MKEERSRWLRRLAVQLAAQLPDDPGEARYVLSETRRLMREFIDRPRQDGGTVISLQNRCRGADPRAPDKA